MSVLRNLFSAEKREANLSEALSLLRERRYGGSFTPGTITAESAMRHSAVWSSVNLIADLISTLPVDEFRRTPGRPVREEEPSPILTDPDRELPPEALFRQALVSTLLRGNATGLILERDELLYPTKTTVLHPDEVSYRREGKLGRLQVRWNGQTLGPDEYWRLVGYTFPGSPVGMSPISYVAETIGLGRNAQLFGLDWFRNGAHPSAVLTNENLQTHSEEGARQVKDQWKESVESGDVGVLAGGWKYQTIQINPEESQFLDTIRANRAMIATIFGLRPEDVGEASGDSMTYANVEQREISRLVYPISQWVIRLERALTSMLRPGRFAKFNTDALIRVDLITRYRAHDMAIRAGWANRNERRELEDLPPIPDDEDGDEYLWPPYRAFKLDEDEEGASNA